MLSEILSEPWMFVDVRNREGRICLLSCVLVQRRDQSQRNVVFFCRCVPGFVCLSVCLSRPTLSIPLQKENKTPQTNTQNK